MAMFGLWAASDLCRIAAFNSWNGDRLWAAQRIYRFCTGCGCVGLQSQARRMRAMLERFADEYEQYRGNVKGFVPFVW